MISFRGNSTMKKLFISLVALVSAIQIGFSQASAQSQGEKSSNGSGAIAGKVTETMNASDYTYVQVDTGTKKVWAAAPKFAVNVGDQVTIAAGMPMEKYHSKTLNRDFDVVYFTDRVSVNGAGGAGASGALPKDHPPIPSQGGHGKPNLDVTGIKKAEGGQTIAEIYAAKSKLSGHEVKVRGKVVKYNPGIMDRNWIHLRDGTGEKGTDDLLVTTGTDVKLGDTVIATGVVALNKDFGANYKYSVMLENAKVTVE